MNTHELSTVISDDCPVKVAFAYKELGGIPPVLIAVLVKPGSGWSGRNIIEDLNESCLKKIYDECEEASKKADQVELENLDADDIFSQSQGMTKDDRA